MSRLLSLAVLVAVTLGLRSVAAGPSVPDVSSGSETALILGFLLLAAYLGGQAAKDFHLPRITGYILLGVLVGPPLLDIVTESDVESLQIIDDIAISLIALSAGAELKLEELRERGRAMLGIMSVEMISVFAVTAGGVIVLQNILPLTAGQSLLTVLTIALVFGSIAIANSPSVAIALINETRSRGPVSSTVLGVTVMKDVVVIVLFAVAISIARALHLEEGFDVAFLGELGVEIGGSLVVGALAGWLVALYLRKYRIHPVLFVLAVAFLNAQVANLLHLEVLLLSLAAGFVAENAGGVRGEDFLEAVEANSFPFYALFFSLAGARIHLEGFLGTLGLFVVLFVLLRAAAVWGGTHLGARLAGAEPAVRQYAWTGFVSQAGVTLGMVVITSRSFPEWGADLTTLFVAMVAIHELVGPVLFQRGLEAAGEVGARDREEERPGTPEPSPASAPAGGSSAKGHGSRSADGRSHGR